MTKVKVITRFKDKNDPAVIYNVGQEVEFADEVRVKDLASRGLVETKSDALAAARAAKAAKAKEDAEAAKEEARFIEVIKACSDADYLNEALEIERSNDNLREAVISAIEARISELESEE